MTPPRWVDEHGTLLAKRAPVILQLGPHNFSVRAGIRVGGRGADASTVAVLARTLQQQQSRA